MWGGATFDVAYRFLHESPWERLDAAARRPSPTFPSRCCCAAPIAVGYTNYPDNLIRAFVKEAAEGGIDVFRVFDSLNWMPGMEVAMDEVLNQGKLLEATICYTGDILDTTRDKYTLEYYVNMAKELEKRGAAHAGHQGHVRPAEALCRPRAGQGAQQDALAIPIHLHTHDTSGNQDGTHPHGRRGGRGHRGSAPLPPCRR